MGQGFFAETTADRPATRTAIGHRSDIDGLRAVAVLSVLAFHANAPGFSGGFVGVDIFFVLSGYLICSIIVREIEQGTFSIGRFYERRCKRILPALFAVLVFCMIVALFVLSPVEAKHLGAETMATALSVSNLHFYHQGDYFDHGGILSPLLMTWSLAVEEQFYFIFPLLMLLLYKRSKRHLFAVLAGACALSLAFSIYCEYRHPQFNFFMLITRGWELGAGTLLAIWHAHSNQKTDRPKWQANVAGIVGLLLIFACVIFYSGATRFPGYEAIPIVLGTLLLLCAEGGVANRVLALRPFVLIGLISYSLYLWHWPLLSFAATVNSEHTPGLSRAMLMLVAAAFAIFSYRFIEQPFRSARYATRSRVLWVYASLIACTFLFGFAFSKTFGFAVRAPELARVERSLALERPHDCIGFAQKGPDVSPDCVPAASSSPVIALLGDSHAEAIESTVRQQALSEGDRLLVMTSYSCPPLYGFTRVLPDGPQHAHACAQFNESTLDIVSRRPDVKVVMLIGSWAMVKDDRFVSDSDPYDAHHVSLDQSRANLLKGLEAEVHQLEANGKHVILLDDWPSIDFAPIDHLRYAELPVRHRLADLLAGRSLQDASATSIARREAVVPSAEAVRGSLIAFARTDPGLEFIDTKQMVCSRSVCSFSDGSNLFYTDGNHMSRFGAERILSHLNLAAAGTK